MDLKVPTKKGKMPHIFIKGEKGASRGGNRRESFTLKETEGRVEGKARIVREIVDRYPNGAWEARYNLKKY